MPAVRALSTVVGQQPLGSAKYRAAAMDTAGPDTVRAPTRGLSPHGPVFSPVEVACCVYLVTKLAAKQVARMYPPAPAPAPAGAGSEEGGADIGSGSEEDGAQEAAPGD
ncbi:hypothetical protein GPECTOR_3g255 [Gonium pectorale]|uniref:Uncharacterized protein n=1 Tax=Gonium pectorale TaxID=33097 RepID=A0A150GZ42_GONPE|nr:hypothetical protein GPECTOR_3g255 [Gonium pectorale]|eukprot:KXZ55101.1 hypothetical protein GPECTOR_3g255 [Gonium pectorale]